jgi:hypothetical protein
MASNRSGRPQRAQRGFLFLANRLCMAASGMKTTSVWGIHGAGDVAFQEDAFFFEFRIGHGDGGQQSFRIRVIGIGKQVVRPGYFLMTFNP